MTVFAAVAVTALLAGARPRVVVLALVGHAVVSELLQWRLLPGRSGDPWDVVADVAGTLAATSVLLLVRRNRAHPSRAGAAADDDDGVSPGSQR